MDSIFQNTLHSDDQIATQAADEFFRSSYTSKADKQEFLSLLDHSRLSDARKKALKEAVIGGQ